MARDDDLPGKEAAELAASGLRKFAHDQIEAVKMAALERDSPVVRVDACNLAMRYLECRGTLPTVESVIATARKFEAYLIE